MIQPFLRSCSVDLFASRLTALLPTYASWKPDPGATYTDAMTLDWSLQKGYAFPPFSLIAPVLKKVSQDKADLGLVAPVWQAQPWWPALLSLLIKNPVMIPNSKHLLRDPAFPLRIHPMYPRLHLAVFQLSGNSTKQKVFQRTLPEYCNQQLVPPLIRHTSQPVNPISTTLNDDLVFLTDRFNNGAAYRSVNVARSAISSYHAKIDGYPVSQHPLVVQLLKGMLNMRPPKPRYTHTWDVPLVTKYLDSLEKTKLLSLKLLSIKLAMLFALSCPERASSFAKLDLRHCRVAPEGVSFTLVSP